MGTTRWNAPEYVRIARILFDSWDPIQVGGNQNLADEYDQYVPAVARLLNSEPFDFAKLHAHLRALENDFGCLIHTDQELNDICTELVAAWRNRAV
jgi:hypothetical protein